MATAAGALRARRHRRRYRVRSGVNGCVVAVVVFPMMRALRAVILIGAAVLVLCLVLTNDADAYTRDCSDAAVWDPDVCERTEALAIAVQADRELLDLMARGAWFTGGVLLALIVSPIFVRAFRFWEE